MGGEIRREERIKIVSRGTAEGVMDTVLSKFTSRTKSITPGLSGGRPQQRNPHALHSLRNSMRTMRRVSLQFTYHTSLILHAGSSDDQLTTNR